MKITVTWEGNMKMKGVGESGYQVQMDAGVEHGGAGEGLRPTELFWISVAGCTSINILEIMRKMQLHLDSFTVEIEAKRQQEQPRAFTHGLITYHFQGENLTKEKIERAITLSLEKYCSLANTLKQGLPIDYTYTIE